MAHPNLLIRISGILLFIIAAVPILPGLRVDNSLERWLPKDSRETQNYNQFLQEFGSDALLILLVETAEKQKAGKEVAATLEQLKAFDYVLDIGTWPARYVEHKQEPSKNYQTFIIRFRPESQANPNRPELLDQIDAMMTQFDVQYSLAGTGVISRAINAQTARDASLFLGIGMLILVIALAFLLRDPIALAQTLLVALAAIASLVFVSVFGGIPMSMAHTVIPVVILFYSTSISMHVLSHGGDFQKILNPSIWVSGTTILGFSAFLPSGIPLLRDFALLGIAGIVGVFGASFCLFYPRVYPFRLNRLMAVTRGIAGLKKRRMVLLVFVLGLLCLPGLWRIKSEIYSLSILESTSKAYRDHVKIQELVGPYFPLEYVVDDSRISRRQLSRWVREVYKMSEVGAVVTYHRFPPLLDLQGLGYRSRTRPDRYRVTFFVPLLSTTQGKALTERIESLGKGVFGSEGPELHGFMKLYANISDALLSAFRSSLLVSFLVISLVMGLYLRNWKLILPSMFVNVLPVMAMLGIMGWLGIRLDMVTIPVGCLLLSIVVDDTIHFMHWYKNVRDGDKALEKAGPGMVLTSAVITAGFAILLLSGAPPVRYFGLLSITAVLFALVSDLFVLPWLLHRMGGSKLPLS